MIKSAIPVAGISTAPIPPPRKTKPSLNSRLAFNYYGSPDKVKPLISQYNGKIGTFSSICDEADLANSDIEDNFNSNVSISENGSIYGDDDESLDDQSVDKNSGPTIDEILESEIPESIIGEGVDIHGEMQFERLLRIDGKFTGKLLSLGNVFVGPTGIYKGNIAHLENVVVSGGLISGNVSAEYICIKNSGSINGNVSCKHLRVIGEENIIVGKINVNPLAPEVIDENGDLVIDADEETFDYESYASSVAGDLSRAHSIDSLKSAYHRDKDMKHNSIKNPIMSSSDNITNNSKLNDLSGGDVGDERIKLKEEKKARRRDLARKVEEEEAETARQRDLLLQLST